MALEARPFSCRSVHHPVSLDRQFVTVEAEICTAGDSGLARLVAGITAELRVYRGLEQGLVGAGVWRMA